MAFDTHAGESTIMKRSRRLLTVALASLAVFVTAGGLLHTRPGIKLMARAGEREKDLSHESLVSIRPSPLIGQNPIVKVLLA